MHRAIFIRPARIVAVNPASARPVATLVAVRTTAEGPPSPADHRGGHYRARYWRLPKSSVEEALIEMYLAGVSVGRVEDITEALCGTRVSPSTEASPSNSSAARLRANLRNFSDRTQPMLLAS
jgi:Transposase, Mutator family